MLFEPTSLPGSFVVRLQRHEDARGWFARSWCRDEFSSRGLNPDLAQCSVSFNARKGTLRGMHFQTPPHAEARLVRCTRGAVHDVIVDLRPDSPTFTRWSATGLTDGDDRMVYVPEGFAHGFQTLRDGTEVFYQMSTPYHPAASSGVRWDDPAFGIDWPLADPILSDKDRAYPDFRPRPAPEPSPNPDGGLTVADGAEVSPDARIYPSSRGTRVVIGKGSRVMEFAVIRAVGGAGDVVIGEHCHINPHCTLYSGNGIRLGDNVLLAPGVSVVPANHAFGRRDVPVRSQGFQPSRGGVVIEDDVWVGANSVILDGALIRRGAVIGAGSVVAGEVGAFSVWAGVPARFVKARD